MIKILAINPKIKGETKRNILNPSFQLLIELENNMLGGITKVKTQRIRINPINELSLTPKNALSCSMTISFLNNTLSPSNIFTLISVLY
jgi:hypothetical protein